MLNRTALAAAALGLMLALPAYAVEKPEGAAAAPSGAPKDAAEHGSSEAGNDAAKNEMKSHNATKEENSKMSDPNKNNR